MRGNNIPKKTDITNLTKNKEIQHLIPSSYTQSLPNSGTKQKLLHTNNTFSPKISHSNNYNHTVRLKQPSNTYQDLQYPSLDNNNNIAFSKPQNTISTLPESTHAQHHITYSYTNNPNKLQSHISN